MSKSRYKGKAKGIMDGLEDHEEKSNGVKDEKSKSVNKGKNDSSKEDRKKRSFILSETQVEKLYMLKAKNKDKTLSAMVGEAIEEYYEQHMDSD